MTVGQTKQATQEMVSVCFGMDHGKCNFIFGHFIII